MRHIFLLVLQLYFLQTASFNVFFALKDMFCIKIAVPIINLGSFIFVYIMHSVAYWSKLD